MYVARQFIAWSVRQIEPVPGQQTYITKGETLEVKGLSPKTIYAAQVATVNASGSAARGLLFETK